MNNETRVVITGLGTVNPLGCNLNDFWEMALAGKSGVSSITNFDIPEGYSCIAGMVNQFDEYYTLSELPEFYDRATKFALVASIEAVKSAKLDSLSDFQLSSKRCGVFIATAIGQIITMEREFCRQANSNFVKASEKVSNCFHFNDTSKILAQHFGWHGGEATIATGCTGGLDAIGYALDAIRFGKVDIVITGSTEAPITPLTVAAFGKIGATSMRNEDPQKASRPFDRDRDGFVLAEGCGILVIESLESALRRNVPILAEISGFSSVNSCYHMTDIPSDGRKIAKSIHLALQDAKIGADKIDVISAHGSSTVQNDVAETNAFHQVFGKRISEIPVTSLKSLIGHPLSASNSIEVIASVMGMKDKVITPTINLDNVDSRCNLNIVANVSRKHEHFNILKTSSGFSGIHSSLVISSFKGM